MDVDLTGTTWRKSTYSNGSGGNCVEIAELGGGRRALRDSKNPDGPKLIFTPGEWEAFTQRVRLSKLA